MNSKNIKIRHNSKYYGNEYVFGVGHGYGTGQGIGADDGPGGPGEIIHGMIHLFADRCEKIRSAWGNWDTRINLP